VQQVHEHGAWITHTESGRLDDAGEDLLRVRATTRAIAARDLTIHDGGPERLLGAPVGCVDYPVEEKAEDGG
jgi:hypothetical protein